MLLGYIFRTLPYIAIISALIYLPFFIYSNHKNGKQSFLYHFAKYTLIGYFLSLIYLTILWYYPDITFQPDYYFLNLQPFIWTQECYDMGTKKMVEQLILNIGMFVPYGLLPLAIEKMQKLWKVASAVFCSTLAIEILQYFMGRSADIDDVIMNFIGGILGYLVFALLNQQLRNKKWWKNMIKHNLE